MSNLNQIIESILVRQISQINQAQENYRQATTSNKIDRLLKFSKNTDQLLRGLNELSQSIITLKEAGICDIDRESLAVFLNRLEESNNEPG